MITDCHCILAMLRNNFSQLFNEQGFRVVRQRKIHTAELLVPEPNALEDEVANEKLKRHKSLGIDQIPAELIKAESRTNCSEIHKFITFIWNKEELPEECF